MIARFTENETGVEVGITFFEAWGSLPRLASVTYPAAVPGGPQRTYGVTEAEIAAHFTVVTPQEIFMAAFGGIYDRPTPDQAKLDVSEVIAP